jgi:hypothetical protein
MRIDIFAAPAIELISPVNVAERSACPPVATHCSSVAVTTVASVGAVVAWAPATETPSHANATAQESAAITLAALAGRSFDRGDIVFMTSL